MIARFDANLALRQIGLVFFLAAIGTRAGTGFGATFESGGLAILLAGALLTTGVTCAAILLGYRYLKLPFAAVMGMTSGIHTQPACLAYANERANNEVPNTWYATVFPASFAPRSMAEYADRSPTFASPSRRDFLRRSAVIAILLMSGSLLLGDIELLPAQAHTGVGAVHLSSAKDCTPPARRFGGVMRRSVLPIALTISIRAVVVLCCLEPASCLAAEQVSPEHAARVIEALVVPYVDVGMFDGVVLVGQRDDVLYERAFGYADYDAGTLNEVDARFRIASISKGFTRYAVALLAQRGKLSLSDPLARYVPEIPRAEDITLKQIVNHQSGIVHINELPWYEEASQRPMSLDSLLTLIAAEPLTFEPGSDTVYSNGAYAVLALVIERVSGQSYGELIHQALCEPAGLQATGHERSGQQVDHLSRGHMPGSSFGERAMATRIDPSVKIGGGSMYSTARDLFRWIRVRRSNALLKADLAAQIGLDPGKMLYEDGRAPGYSAVAVHNPETDIALVMLSNNYATLTLDEIIMATLVSDSVPVSPIAGCSRTRSSQLQYLIGAYQWPEPFGTRIELREHLGEIVYVELFRPDKKVGLAATPDGAILCPLYNCVLRPHLEGSEVAGLSVEAGWTTDTLMITRTGPLGE